MPTKSPDVNAILDALQHALLPTDAGDPGYTTDELVARTGRSILAVQRALKQLHAEGRLVVGQQRRPCYDGRVRRYTVYRVT